MTPFRGCPLQANFSRFPSGPKSETFISRVHHMCTSAPGWAVRILGILFFGAGTGANIHVIRWGIMYPQTLTKYESHLLSSATRSSIIEVVVVEASDEHHPGSLRGSTRSNGFLARTIEWRQVQCRVCASGIKKKKYCGNELRCLSFGSPSIPSAGLGWLLL